MDEEFLDPSLQFPVPNRSSRREEAVEEAKFEVGRPKFEEA